MSESLRRIQYVTTYFEWVQGLRFVPMGLMGLGLAVWMALADPPLRLREHPVVVAVAVAVAAGFYVALGLYYRRRFGEVRPSASTRQRTKRLSRLALVAGLVVAGASDLIRWFGGPSQLPTLVGLALFGLALVYCWHWSGRVAHHYLVIAAVLLVLGVLDALGLSPVCALLKQLPSAPVDRCVDVTMVGAAGLVITALGVLDHLLLARLLGPPPESEEAPG